MNPNRKPDITKQIERARMTVMEQGLIGFVEDVDGKVPTDEEILTEGEHALFSKTPLTVYAKDGHEFIRYYIWRRKHVVALAFSEKDLITLYIARVPNDEWPPALKAFVGRERPVKEGGDA